MDRVKERASLTPLSQVRNGLVEEDFLSQLKTKRLLEVYGEGHRWKVVARWGDLGPQQAYRDPASANFVKGKNELLPIPQ